MFTMTTYGWTFNIIWWSIGFLDLKNIEIDAKLAVIGELLIRLMNGGNVF